jgi:hypothetical protein
MNTTYLACLAAAALVLGACDSPLDVDPTASIDAETALSTSRGIEIGLNGAYRALQEGDLYGLEEMVLPDLYADNLDFTGTFQTHREIALRSIPTSNGAVLAHWASAYAGINRANNILAAIDAVTTLTPAKHDQYRGEALFIRGLLYHIMLRYFGDVPLVLTPSVGAGSTSLVARAPAAQVYRRIETDLEEATTLLPAARNVGRATQGAANALLARVYLDQLKSTQARDKATLLLNATATYSLNPSFRSNWSTKNSAESIFELPYSVNNRNGQAFWFYPTALGGRWGFAPSLSLVRAFEVGDARLAASIQTLGTSRYGYKYHRIANGDDNVIVLRLAEMYLIRAEANVRLGAADGTVRADLDAVRARAGLAPLTVTGQAALLAAVLQERRVELAFEGHRFFDLRRHGVATTVLGIPANRLLFPIPQAERDVNTNLAQNPGY